MEGFSPYYRHTAHKYLPWVLLGLWGIMVVFLNYLTKNFIIGKYFSYSLITIVLLVNVLYINVILVEKKKKKDLPFSKLRSASQGIVKVKGKLMHYGNYGRTSPLSGIPCLAYRAEVFHKDLSVWKEKWSTSAMIECQGDYAFIPYYMLENKDLFHFKSYENPIEIHDTLKEKLAAVNFSLTKEDMDGLIVEEELIIEGMEVSILGFFKSLPGTQTYLDAFQIINNKPEPIFWNQEEKITKLKTDWSAFVKSLANQKSNSSLLKHAFFEYNSGLPIITPLGKEQGIKLSYAIVYSLILWLLTFIFYIRPLFF
jgi:hypothetical protein